MTENKNLLGWTPVICFAIVIISVIAGMYVIIDYEEKRYDCYENTKKHFCEAQDMELGSTLVGIRGQDVDICRDDLGNVKRISYEDTWAMCEVLRS